MQTIINNNSLIFMEAAVIERLRRSKNIKLHPTLVNAPLIYNEKGKAAMTEIYNSYMDVAEEQNKPIFMCTPTWRCNQERITASEITTNINKDAIEFMKEIRDTRGSFGKQIKIGGLIGCKNDCYLPEEGLSVKEAEEFHAWQINKLMQGGADFLIAETLPALGEAIGLAKAISKTNMPYIIGFVINRQGKILDETSMYDAILTIDKATPNKPLLYMINCAYPSFICPEEQPEALFSRLKGIMGNGSSLDHCDLEEAEQLHADSVKDWGDNMLDLHNNYGFKLLGGCCGTDIDHLKYIASKSK